mgnify:FL=1
MSAEAFINRLQNEGVAFRLIDCDKVTLRPPKGVALSVEMIGLAKQYKPDLIRYLTKQPANNLGELLKGSLFTLAMIEEGLERWKQPFCENDLADVEAGKWSREGIERYLSWWAGRYKEHYRELRFEELPRTSRKESFYD